MKEKWKMKEEWKMKEINTTAVDDIMVFETS